MDMEDEKFDMKEDEYRGIGNLNSHGLVGLFIMLYLSNEEDLPEDIYEICVKAINIRIEGYTNSQKDLLSGFRLSKIEQLIIFYLQEQKEGLIEAKNLYWSSQEGEKYFAAVKIDEIINFVDKKINENKSKGIADSKSLGGQLTFTTLEYALFHYYKQEGGYEQRFQKNNTTSKRDIMKEQGVDYGVSGDAFANSYYIIIKKDRRIIKGNVSHIKAVIELLSEYPAGKIIAEAELKQSHLLQ